MSKHTKLGLLKQESKVRVLAQVNEVRVAIVRCTGTGVKLVVVIGQVSAVRCTGAG